MFRNFPFAPFFFFCAHLFFLYLFAADQRLCLIDHGFFLGLSIYSILFLVGVLLCVIKFSSCNRSVGCLSLLKFCLVFNFKAMDGGRGGVVESVDIIIHSCKFCGFKPTGRSLRNNYCG